jgi:hypothetical protein
VLGEVVEEDQSPLLTLAHWRLQQDELFAQLFRCNLIVDAIPSLRESEDDHAIVLTAKACCESLRLAAVNWRVEHHVRHALSNREKRTEGDSGRRL